jgi:demethylmenaquinone methyltransferase/2-methoxy-6-polyprenyl-1,4-benzoquinol methylase
MLPEEANEIAEHQRRRFNELVDVFDRPQPPEVMARLREIVASAELHPGAVVLDVGTGAGVLIPLIQSYQPSTVLACDVAEKMLQRVQEKYPGVRIYHTDIVSVALASTSVDVIFMNGMYGNIADKPAACGNAARMLRSGECSGQTNPSGVSEWDFLSEAESQDATAHREFVGTALAERVDSDQCATERRGELTGYGL